MDHAAFAPAPGDSILGDAGYVHANAEYAHTAASSVAPAPAPAPAHDSGSASADAGAYQTGLRKRARPAAGGSVYDPIPPGRPPSARQRARALIRSVRESRLVALFLRCLWSAYRAGQPVVRERLRRMQGLLRGYQTRAAQRAVSGVVTDEMGHEEADRAVERATREYTRLVLVVRCASAVLLYSAVSWLAGWIGASMQAHRYTRAEFRAESFARLASFSSKQVELHMPVSNSTGKYAVPLTDKGIAFFSLHAEFPCAEFMGCAYNQHTAPGSAAAPGDRKHPRREHTDFEPHVASASLAKIPRVFRHFVRAAPLRVSPLTKKPECVLFACVVEKAPAPVLLMTLVQRMINTMTKNDVACLHALDMGYAVQVFIMRTNTINRDLQLPTDISYDIYANPCNFSATGRSVHVARETGDLNTNATHTHEVLRWKAARFSALKWKIDRWVTHTETTSPRDADSVSRAACVQHAINRFGGVSAPLEFIVEKHSNSSTPIDVKSVRWMDFVLKHHTIFSSRELNVFDTLADARLRRIAAD